MVYVFGCAFLCALAGIFVFAAWDSRCRWAQVLFHACWIFVVGHLAGLWFLYDVGSGDLAVVKNGKVTELHRSFVWTVGGTTSFEFEPSNGTEVFTRTYEYDYDGHRERYPVATIAYSYSFENTLDGAQHRLDGKRFTHDELVAMVDEVINKWDGNDPLTEHLRKELGQRLIAKNRTLVDAATIMVPRMVPRTR